MDEWSEPDRVRMGILQLLEIPAAGRQLQEAMATLKLENEVARSSGDLKSGFSVMASQAAAERLVGERHIALASLLEEVVEILRRNNPEAEFDG